MSLEKWSAIASVGLFVMFAGEMISIYYFMINAPTKLELGIEFEPGPKILQFISIGLAPASILASLSFILSKRYGSKQIGALILTGGIILFLGMTYCYVLMDKLSNSYLTETVIFAPPIFMGISIPIMIVGAFLIKKNKKRPKKEFF
jgi:hypothetical protein